MLVRWPVHSRAGVFHGALARTQTGTSVTMTARSTDKKLWAAQCCAWCSLLAAAACGMVHAGVTVDGSMGRAATLSGPTYVIGAQSGRSDPGHRVLFHSFGEFSLTAGEKAVFRGPLTTENIVVRVTGGSPSS